MRNIFGLLENASLTSMTSMSPSADAVVVGGGIIGLATAWRARQSRAVGDAAGAWRHGAGYLPCGGGDARAGRRGRVRRGRPPRTRPRAAFRGAVARLCRRAGGGLAGSMLACAAAAPSWWRATPTRPASWSARSHSAIRSSCRPSVCCRAPPARPSPRWRRPCVWPSWPRTITLSIRVWCSPRCAAHARRRAWRCASTRQLRGSSSMARAGANG